MILDDAAASLRDAPRPLHQKVGAAPIESVEPSSPRPHNFRYTTIWMVQSRFSGHCTNTLASHVAPLGHLRANAGRRGPETPSTATHRAPAGPLPGWYEWRAPRSEERRVGKECRSRWSP